MKFFEILMEWSGNQVNIIFNTHHSLCNNLFDEIFFAIFRHILQTTLSMRAIYSSKVNAKSLINSRVKPLLVEKLFLPLPDLSMGILGWHSVALRGIFEIKFTS